MAPGERARRRMWRDVRAGISALVHTRGAWPLIVPIAGQTFVRGALNVLAVAVALQLFGLGQSGVGWLSAAMGLGALLGVPLALLLVRGRRCARPFGAAIAGWGLPLIALGAVHWKYAPYLLLTVVGVANVVGDVAVDTSLQRLIPPRQIGRAMGACELIALASVALGSAAAPGLIDLLGARQALMVLGGLLVLVPLAETRLLRAIDHRLADPGPNAGLLRQLAFLRPLPVGTVEHLATELTGESYQPGEVVVREGEPGDRFYLIEAGRAHVEAGGLRMPDLGPGDCFGEIALLRQGPRTATVTAASTLRLLSLSQAEFLTAVTGNADSVVAAGELTAERLARSEPRV
jgi:hypothetical protein